MVVMSLIFVIGYIFIAFEHRLKINKAAFALLTAVLLWTLFTITSDDRGYSIKQLLEHLGDISQILFFLLGAMTIVELIDMHDGFYIITSRIKTSNLRSLVWIIGVISFFVSAVLDNLTTTIVMVSLIRKLVTDRPTRLKLAGLIVIAANAGGAWTVIGDVTTTMLWIGGQVTPVNIMRETFAASMTCLIVPILLMLGTFKKGQSLPAVTSAKNASPTKNLQSTPFERNLVFCIGVGALIFVPIFKSITHLPPYMGILFGLSILWIITEIIHNGKNDDDRRKVSVTYALQKIDSTTILFFLGILLSVTSLQSNGALSHLAVYVSRVLPNLTVVASIIGLLSAVVDNVPLVAAIMKMYTLQQFPSDHYFWELIAYTAGTGGSILIIGSAAGVAAMGMEKIDFFWYIKHISLIAAAGYFAGIGVYLLQNLVL